ncbi:MAG: hypothetical protein J2P17_06860, partial [Mycobacterium sp.]|nr:hypothetical protein [Mycobacterium sp.]
MYGFARIVFPEPPKTPEELASRIRAVRDMIADELSTSPRRDEYLYAFQGLRYGTENNGRILTAEQARQAISLEDQRRYTEEFDYQVSQLRNPRFWNSEIGDLAPVAGARALARRRDKPVNVRVYSASHPQGEALGGPHNAPADGALLVFDNHFHRAVPERAPPADLPSAPAKTRPWDKAMFGLVVVDFDPHEPESSHDVGTDQLIGFGNEDGLQYLWSPPGNGRPGEMQDADQQVASLTITELIDSPSITRVIARIAAEPPASAHTVISGPRAHDRGARTGDASRAAGSGSEDFR